MQNRNQNLNGAQIGAMVREEDLEELQALQKELRNRIDKSKTDGRIYMMQQYTVIIAGVNSEVDRVHRRFNRESLAGIRREIKELKGNGRGETEE